MESVLLEWLSLALRWAHVIIGIGWIGASFHFVWLDASLRKRDESEGVQGESWMVHGGGFYHLRKYLVAPERLPEELHWFKYESYFTWVTGFLLLAVVYYLGADAFLVNKAKLALAPWQAIGASAGSLLLGWLLYDLLCRSPLGRRTGRLAVAVFLLILAAAFLYGEIFAPRAAYLHVGAFVGTIMTANVFFVIIPNQKKAVAKLLAGERPEAALGLQAKQRSLHNNYLTLPVVLLMLSNHYPLLYAREEAWLLIAPILLLGALVRHYVNLGDAGVAGWRRRWLLPAAGAVALALVWVTLPRESAVTESEAAPVTLAEVMPVVAARCQSCHAERPSDPDFTSAPGGILLEQPEQVAAMAERIRLQVVETDAMPLANRTGMTEAERALFARWLAGGAPER